MAPPKYTLKTVTPCRTPIKPGTGSITIAYVISTQLADPHWKYKVNKNIYNVYHATDKACKLQLLAAIDNFVYKELYGNNVNYIYM